jgi:hypothetical protein
MNFEPNRPEITEAARLSKLLFDAREQIDMWATVVANRTGLRENGAARLRDEIDAYRAERGWSPNGFGGESG